MKIIRTKGRGARQAAEIISTLERRGSAALDTVLPAVTRIVADVRKGGDRALLRYARRFDGLDGADALRVSGEEMASAWQSTDTDLQAALSKAADQIKQFASRQMPQSSIESAGSGLTTGQLVRPLG